MVFITNDLREKIQELLYNNILIDGVTFFFDK
jgi:hypothetical protein